MPRLNKGDQMKKHVVVIALALLPNSTFAADVSVIDAEFYRSARGHNEARLTLKNTSKFSIMNVWTNNICAYSARGETVCAGGAQKIRIDKKQAQTVWVDFGRTHYPLERAYVRK